MDNNSKRLHRSSKNRVFAGIAGGIGQYFNVDPTIVRLVLLLLFFFTGPLIVGFYVVAMLFVPQEPGHQSEEQEGKWLEGRRGMVRMIFILVLILIALSFLFWGSMFAMYHPMGEDWFWDGPRPMRF